jgi:hypothetical protein
MSVQDRPLIDTPTKEETIAALAERFSAEEAAREMQAAEQRGLKVLGILADRARWGWRMTAPEFGGVPLFAVPGALFVSQDQARLHPQWDRHAALVPVLRIASMEIELTEQELADLGPCPNL